jgi:hypothetical protein
MNLNNLHKNAITCNVDQSEGVTANQLASLPIVINVDTREILRDLVVMLPMQVGN